MKESILCLVTLFTYINYSLGQICLDSLLIVPTITDKKVNSTIYSSNSVSEVTNLVVTTSDNVATDTAKNYFSFTNDDNKFELSTTETFANLNDDATPTNGKPLSISLTCNCANNLSTVLMINVENTNQNAPEFSKSDYSYKVPMPLMPKVDFTLYGDLIIVKDIDFDNTDITFTVDSDDFSLSTTSMGNKQYKAVISTNKVLSFTQTQTFQITATDSGNTPNSQTVSISIEVDADTGLDIPFFSNTEFTFNYTQDSEPTLINTGSDITLTTNKPTGMQNQLNGDYKDYFSLSFKEDIKTFTLDINSNSPLPADVNSPVVLSLTVTTDTTTSAIIVITVLKFPPKFSEKYYIGSYSFDTNIITWDNAITVSKATSVNLSGDKKDLFDINDTTYEIKPKTPLVDTDFDENSNIVLTVTAESESGTAQAIVIISVPTTSVDDLQFSSIYYEGTYSIDDDDKGTVSLKDEINVIGASDLTDISVAVEDSFKEYFEIQLDAKKWVLKVDKNLPDSIIKSTSPLLISLTASRSDGTGKASAVLILELPDISSDELTFSSIYYEGTYSIDDDDKGTVSLKDEINVIGASDLTDISVAVEDSFKEYFEIQLDAKKWVLKVDKNLPDSIIKSTSPLLISLTASRSDGTGKASAVLILELPDISSDELTFSSIYYEGTYSIDDDDKGTVSLKDEINVIGASDLTDISVAVEDSFKEYFEIQLDAKKWVLKVDKNLPDSIIKSTSPLLISLTASRSDGTGKASAVLILELPDISSDELTFSSIYYEGTYSIDDDDKGTVSLKDEINVIGASDLTDISVAVEDSFKEYFEIQLDAKKWVLKVNKNLPDSIIKSTSPLLISLTASRSDGTGKASAVLILELPDISSDEITFSSIYYEGTYSIDDDDKGTVSLKDEINVIGASDLTDISVAVEDSFKEYFEIQLDAKKWVLKVDKNLPDSIIKSTSPLLISLTASRSDGTGKASAVLILELPDISSDELTFSSIYYEGTYSIDDDDKGTVSLKDEINVIGASDLTDISVAVEDSFKEYFEIQLDAKKWVLKVEKNLPDSIIKSTSPLLISLTASRSDGIGKASAVLILELPDISSDELTFSSIYYEGTYSIDDDDKGTVSFKDEINVIGASDLTDISVAVEDSFKEYFEIQLDAKKWVLKVNKNLPDSIIKSTSPLLISLTASRSDGTGKASAVLILELPDISSDEITFSSIYYEGTYSIDDDDKGTVSLKDEINVIGASDLTDISVAVEDSFKEYFEIQLDAKKWVLKVDKNLPDSIIKSTSPLLISLTASRSDGTGKASAVLILELPDISSDELTFSSIYYEGTYSIDDDDKGTVSLKDEINVIGASDLTDISVAVEDSFKEYFEIQLDAKKWVLKVNKNLPDSIIKSTSPLLISLTASRSDGTGKASAVLILELPDISSDELTFSSIYYEGTYSIDDDDKGTVSLKDEINVIGASDLTDISVAVEDSFKEYFEIQLDAKKWVLKVDKNLPDSIIKSTSPLLISLTASRSDGTGKASAVLILELPDISSDGLIFSSIYYEGTYSIDDDDKGVVSLKDQINVKGASDLTDISVAVEDSFKEYFKIELDAQKWVLKVEKNLPDSIIKSTSPLLISLTASRSDGTGKASAVLILKLPDIMLKFSKDYYSAKYVQEDSGADTINIEEVISLEGSGISTVVLSFIGYDQYFEGSCDSATLICDIKLSHNLNATVLSSNSEIMVTITATSGTVVGQAVILVKLPSSTSTFSFSELYYSAEYFIEKTVDGIATVTLYSPISFKDASPSDITITSSGSNFQLNYDLSNKVWKIIVKENLASDTLAKNTELIIDLTAKNGESNDYSNAILIVKLPDKISIAFRSPHYKAEYVVGANGVDKIKLIDESGIELTDYDNIDIVLSSYSENFNIRYDKSQTTIEVASPLNNSVLTQYSELQIPMIISKAGVKYGDCVLTVKLPSLSFAESFYIGYYTENNNAGSIDMTTIKIDKADSSLIDMTLSEYTDYFNLVLANDVWTLNSLKPLTGEIKSKYNNLPITLTATRKSDNVILATSPIVVNLPQDDNTDQNPEFTKFTFLGSYTKSDDGASVVLNGDITIQKNQDLTKITIYIEDSEYSDHFTLVKKDDDSYEVQVSKALADDVLNSETSLVYTLVAQLDDGQKDYATLIITLPKTFNQPSVKFNNILYKAEYDDGRASATLNLDTKSDDNNIKIVLTDDNNLSSYFTTSYSKGTLKVTSDNLPQTVIDNFAMITLKITATDKSTEEQASAVLNVKIINGGNGKNGNNSNDDSAPMNKGLLVAVIILACLLVSFIIAVVFYWYFKIRATKYADIEDDVKIQEIKRKDTKFIKNDIKKRPESTSSVSIRRPTGIHIQSTQEHTDDIEAPEEPVDVSKPVKIVAFKDDVENIDGDENDIPSTNYLNVSERRPTKFVFGNPLEEGVLDPNTLSPDDERKKSVAFDEHIERMQIESVEEDEDDKQDDEDDEESDNDDTVTYNVTKDKEENGDLQIDDKPSEMPSNIFKEIF